MFNKKSRFTLIELIVVIAVLGILSAIVIPNISNMNEKAKVAAVKSNIRNIQIAVDMYKLEKDSYPTDKQPEFIEDKDNPDNPSGFLVGKEPINFIGNDFVTNYLRDIPKDGNIYYVDAWGIVSVESGDNDNLQPEVPQTKEKIRIMANGNHSFAILDTGEVYSWGSNTFGQLGLGNNSHQNTPQLVEFFNNKKVKDIKLGQENTFAILETGEIYSWGYNKFGQLGIENTMSQNTPQLVTFFNDKKVRDIILGGYHSFSILENGEVYSWGYNSNGELGLGNEIQQNIPQLVLFFNDKKVKEIKTGESHTFAIMDTGEIYSWGSDTYGQLGLGNETNQNTPQLVSFFNDKKVKNISLDGNHTFVTLESGSVYGFGNNSAGQLGLGHEINQSTPQLVTFFNDKKIIKLELGTQHSIAILENGEVYGWGQNTQGQLGLGHSSNRNTPQLLEFFKDKKVKNIVSGIYHTLATLENGEVYSWGYNYNGQLGLGHNTQVINSPELLTLLK